MASLPFINVLNLGRFAFHSRHECDDGGLRACVLHTFKYTSAKIVLLLEMLEFYIK